MGFLRVLAIAHGAQETGQTEEMVPVQVGDEDPGYPARLDAALLNLNLRSLAAVEYPDLSIVCMEAGSMVTRDTRKDGI